MINIFSYISCILFFYTYLYLSHTSRDVICYWKCLKTKNVIWRCLQCMSIHFIVVTSRSMTSKSSVRLRLVMLTSMSQCHDVSIMAWLSFWLASNATEKLTSTAPQSANPTATSAATMCRARTAAVELLKPNYNY